MNTITPEQLLGQIKQLEKALDILRDTLGPAGEEAVHNALVEVGYYEED